MKPWLPLCGLAISLGTPGCSKSPDTVSVANNAETMAAALEQKADNLEAMAGGAANASVAAILDGSANTLDVATGTLPDATGNEADR